MVCRQNLANKLTCCHQAPLPRISCSQLLCEDLPEEDSAVCDVAIAYMAQA